MASFHLCHSRRTLNRGCLLFSIALVFAGFTFFRLFNQTDHIVVVTPRGKEVAVALSDSEESVLRQLFPKLDLDHNQFWSLQEIESWIKERVAEHMNAALRENVFIFTAMDSNPRDGVISWEEYYSWFLKKNKVALDRKGRIFPGHNLSRDLKEKIAWDKAQWSEAVRSDPWHLSLDEFLSFRHPESSAASLLARVDAVMFELDSDSDGILHWEEFNLVTSRTVNVQHFFTKSALLTFKTDILLKKEFVVADKDKSGAVDRGELTAYLDPKNTRHSQIDAEMLLELADDNGDFALSLEEVLLHGEAVLESKIVDAGKVFHDEF